MYIRIEDPCTENWKEMSPTQIGAFCQKCQKEVVDFTSMSKEEAKSVLLRSSNENVCGRISPNQLEILNSEYEEFKFRNKKSFQVAFLYSLLIAFGLSLFSCSNEEQKTLVGNIQRVHVEDSNNLENEQNDDLILGEIEATESIDLLELVQNNENKPIQLNYTWIDTISSQIILNTYDTEVYETMGMVRMDYEYMDHLMETVSIIDSVEVVQIQKIEESSIDKFDALAWPNPTTGLTNLRVDLKWSQLTEIAVYDLMGRKLFNLQNGKLKAGPHEFQFDLSGQPKGSYIVVINSPSFKKSLKIAKL